MTWVGMGTRLLSHVPPSCSQDNKLTGGNPTPGSTALGTGQDFLGQRVTAALAVKEEISLNAPPREELLKVASPVGKRSKAKVSQQIKETFGQVLQNSFGFG